MVVAGSQRLVVAFLFLVHRAVDRRRASGLFLTPDACDGGPGAADAREDVAGDVGDGLGRVGGGGRRARGAEGPS